jgi:signal peptidase I
VKKITYIATISAVVLLMVIAALVYVGPRFGYRADNIVSGSMEPTISAGTMIVAHSVATNALSVGDIITFKPVNIGEYNMAHRIVKVSNTFPRTFTTKGDALAAPDPFDVPAANVLGRVEFHAPMIGNFIQFLRGKTGLFVGLVIPALVIMALIVQFLWKDLVKYIRSKPA